MEFNVQDEPNNSKCVDGWRYIPIELIDLPGLIKDAWKGKGLGNQFLSIAAQSDALYYMLLIVLEALIQPEKYLNLVLAIRYLTLPTLKKSW